MSYYLDFEKMAEDQTGRLHPPAQSDGENEYLSADMEEHFRSLGTYRQLTIA